MGKVKDYIVTISAVYPAAGEHPGEIDVVARDNNHAIKQARNYMFENGHTRHDGPIHYRARVKR